MVSRASSARIVSPLLDSLGESVFRRRGYLPLKVDFRMLLRPQELWFTIEVHCRSLACDSCDWNLRVRLQDRHGCVQKVLYVTWAETVSMIADVVRKIKTRNIGYYSKRDELWIM